MTAAMEDSIQRYPLLRLLIPYICGIGLADVCYPMGSEWRLYIPWVTLSAILLCILACHRQILFGIVASSLFVMLGTWNYLNARDFTIYAWSNNKEIYEARIESVPHASQHSLSCRAEITAMHEPSAWKSIERRAIIYFESCNEASALLPGDKICFNGKIQRPHNFNEESTFDYARYVTMQGVAGTVYLPCTQWYKVEISKTSFRNRMLRLRERLVQKYMKTSFKGDILGVLAAITLGDKHNLSSELQSEYTDAGAAHILAISGMHVGIIYGMLVWGLRRLIRRHNLRWLRELIAMVVLWIFALLVGAPASIVRAVTMCSIYILARWATNEETSSLHVLDLTALLMLLIRPLYLFEVGFQLSFMAMTAILWMMPYLETFLLHRIHHPVLIFFANLLCLSLIAQLGTSPLVLLHFGVFPCYFLLTNLIVVPCLSIVLLLSLIWWGLLPFSTPLSHPLSLLLHHIVTWTNWSIGQISNWRGAVLTIENFSSISALFSYLLILFLGLFLFKKWERGATLALASLLGLILSLLL